MIELTMENLIQIPSKAGVYRIFALRNKLPISINRFAKIDNTGLLYIGQTSGQTLRKRAYNFLATSRSNSNTTNHSGALKYRLLPIIQQILADHKLYFDFEICENPLFRERELIGNYKSIFGECPILNK
ncbi:hypothetical protein [Flavobacterium sharifuzzamanii]|uniref:hypothetical protein n=1 Tax=Flavobacterium sharifuzzamanii TaxID=2211133 RepID=UPI000DACC33D|nr:hypothetical protein [Flavobacterium sharifuzzamanii]KAF2081702.1 hypothetical protein DMA14_07855 [Flavobacterium sharifuzzamanii]